MGKKLEAAIPDAALIIHAGAGHYAYLDFPDKTANIMDALYRSPSPKNRRHVAPAFPSF